MTLKRLLFIVVLGLLSACSAFGARQQANGSPSPIVGTLSPPASSPQAGGTTATLEPPLLPSLTHALPSSIPTLSPFTTWTPTIPPTPTPTWTGTPPTPTQLATPYVIDLLDWEIITAESPELCAGCDLAVTTIDVPRGLGIALVQVFIEGASGDRTILTTDLLYAFPQELRCTRQAENGFCGMVFGQVYSNQLTLSARYTAGGTHKLEYIVTFQSWADYSP